MSHNCPAGSLRKPEIIARKRIEIEHLATFIVENPTGVDRVGDTIVSGVPLKRGTVTDARCLVLRDYTGKRIPAQAGALARWPDGSVKWALITARRFSIKAGKTAKVSLTVEKSSTPKGITIRKTARGLRVNAGRFRFTIATGQGRPLVPSFESKVAGKWKKRAVNLDLAMTVERGNRKRRYLASLAERTIDIEQQGPLRTLIRVRGTHAAEKATGSFGPYTLRLEILANSSQLRLTHSFIYDGDPEKDFVRASEVIVYARVGEDHRFGFGGDDGCESRFVRQRAKGWTPDFRYAELYQDSVTHWQIRRWVDLDRREVFCEEGLRTDGWMELAGRDGRLAAAVRECWQNHPKTLFADAASGEMRIGLYPARADRLDLRRYSDHVYSHTYESPAFREEKTIRFDKERGAHGIRKTHDLMLMFDEPNPSGSALAYNEPLLLQWTPAYTARSGGVVPAASKLDKTWLARMNAYLDFIHREMLESGGTGYVDYFDLPHGFNLPEGRWFHDFGGFGYLNNEAMPILGLWQAYLLTGRRDAFHMARAMSRHNADIDCYHTGPWAGWGSRHNVNHWGCMCHDRRISQPIGKRFLHYLTGDRSVLDLTELVLESFRRETAEPRKLNMKCDVPALVSTLLLAQETGLAEVEKWLESLADALAESVTEQGQLMNALLVNSTDMTAAPVADGEAVSFMMLSQFGGPQAFAELAERYDHNRLRQALVRFARYRMLPRNTRRKMERFGNYRGADCFDVFRALDLLGYAYAVTKDPAILKYTREHMRSARVAIEDQLQRRYGVEGASKRTVPVLAAFPDEPPSDATWWKQKYPLIPQAGALQFYNISMYLHKMQGLMLLAGSTKRPD